MGSETIHRIVCDTCSLRKYHSGGPTKVDTPDEGLPPDWASVRISTLNFEGQEFDMCPSCISYVSIGDLITHVKAEIEEYEQQEAERETKRQIAEEYNTGLQSSQTEGEGEGHRPGLDEGL